MNAIDTQRTSSVAIDWQGAADRALRAAILQRSTSGDVGEAPLSAPLSLVPLATSGLDATGCGVVGLGIYSTRARHRRRMPVTISRLNIMAAIAAIANARQRATRPRMPRQRGELL